MNYAVLTIDERKRKGYNKKEQSKSLWGETYRLFDCVKGEFFRNC